MSIVGVQLKIAQDFVQTSLILVQDIAIVQSPCLDYCFIPTTLLIPFVSEKIAPELQSKVVAQLRERKKLSVDEMGVAKTKVG